MTRYVPRFVRTFASAVGQFRYLLLGLMALIVVAVGGWGWLQSDPTLSPGEALYRSFGLFTISMSDDVGALNPALEFARWAAIVVAGASLLSVARDAIQDVQLHQRLRDAKRARGHVVVVGQGTEAVQIALSFGTTNPHLRVVVIGSVANTRLPELKEKRVLCLDGANDGELTEILRDAHLVVVVGATDHEAMTEATRVGGLRRGSVPVTVLFDDRDLASQWNRSRSERAVCRPVRVAIELLREEAPVREDAVVPPAVVFGDGRVAVEIVRRIITGWQEPGEKVEVHVVSDSRALLGSIRVGLEARCEVHCHSMDPHAELAPRVLQKVIAGFRHMDFKDRVTVVGPRVYVAYGADELTVTVAAALAEQVPEAVVTGVIEETDPWATASVDDVSMPKLSSIGDLLTSRHAIEKDVTALLTEEIVADAHRWPEDAPSVFGVDAASEVLARRIAESASDLLAVAGLELDSRVWPARLAPLLGPDELRAMSAELAFIFQNQRKVDRAHLLELAARLPTLIARAGHTPDWSHGRESLVSAEEVEALAKAAHESYKVVAREGKNATNSENADQPWADLAPMEVRSNFAQTADIPLKLAMCGLSWRRTESPRSFSFDPEELEFLAEQEHRRWRHFQFRNGRRRGEWDKPWAELTEKVKDYDRRAVKAIPGALAKIGIEIVRVPMPEDRRSG